MDTSLIEREVGIHQQYQIPGKKRNGNGESAHAESFPGHDSRLSCTKESQMRVDSIDDLFRGDKNGEHEERSQRSSRAGTVSGARQSAEGGLSPARRLTASERGEARLGRRKGRRR